MKIYVHVSHVPATTVGGTAIIVNAVQGVVVGVVVDAVVVGAVDTIVVDGIVDFSCHARKIVSRIQAPLQYHFMQQN